MRQPHQASSRVTIYSICGLLETVALSKKESFRLIIAVEPSWTRFRGTAQRMFHSSQPRQNAYASGVIIMAGYTAICVFSSPATGKELGFIIFISKSCNFVTVTDCVMCGV